MQILSKSRFWHVTDAERSAAYPCHRFATEHSRSYLRAIDIEAGPELTFRWVCQLKVAPYSYDWVDNRGRRSPTTLTPGSEDLAEGQRFMIARIVEFEAGRHITAVTAPEAERLFGPIALTYQVSPRLEGSRLVVCMSVGARGPVGRLKRELLGWGDLIMMRKQLMTLKERAEHSAQAASS